MTLEGIGEAEARRRQQETDRTRALYLKRFYNFDADDPHLYHLMIDSTVLSATTCTELITAAASTFWSASLKASVL
jgi:cytidylate kinase